MKSHDWELIKLGMTWNADEENLWRCKSCGLHRATSLNTSDNGKITSRIPCESKLSQEKTNLHYWKLIDTMNGPGVVYQCRICGYTTERMSQYANKRHIYHPKSISCKDVVVGEVLNCLSCSALASREARFSILSNEMQVKRICLPCRDFRSS